MLDRIRTIMEYYDLTSAQFADTIGIQRSALSHVLSERNKPSLDFVLKIKRAFPEVSLDWLTLGRGSIHDEVGAQSETSIPSDFDIRPETVPTSERMKGAEDMNESDIFPETEKKQGRDVKEIVVYYTDHTYRRFVPERE